MMGDESRVERGNLTYEGSMSFAVTSDEDVEALGEMGFGPVIYVSDGVMGWDEKPFIAVGD